MLKYFKARPFHTFRWFFYKHLTARSYLKCPVLDREMTLDLRVGGISRALALYGTREEDMLKIIRDSVKPDMHILDLGANIGYYTLEFSSLIGDTGLLLAVEPDPRNFTVLKKNVETLNATNIILKRFAVSNVKAINKMLITEKSNLNTLVVPEGHAQCELIDVETETISDIAKIHMNGRLDFIRMDIEGYEYEAIIGLFDYLDAAINKPIILFEVHPKAYGSSRDMKGLLHRLIETYNYRIDTIVSTNGGKCFFDKAGAKPSASIVSDGFKRFIYNNIPKQIAIDGILQHPKCVRYALMV